MVIRGEKIAKENVEHIQHYEKQKWTFKNYIQTSTDVKHGTVKRSLY